MERIKELTKFLNDRAIEYDEGHPIISDEEWDSIYFELKELEKKHNLTMENSPTQTINYEIVSKLEKVKHNHKMLSLDKTKDWDEFLHYFYNLNSNKSIVGMLKLDGLTCSLRYVDGILVGAETRGNGEIGENILHNAKVISSIPNEIDWKEELIIDGEIICTYEDFKDFENEYKNPRNFAAGSIRLLDSKECSRRKLTFVAWNVIKGIDNNSFYENLEKISQLGFKVVPWTVSFDFDAKEFLINKAKELGYPIDGLVGRFDDVEYGNSLGETGHHARAAYAFKFYDEEYETVLKDIEWTMGRTGVLTPVAVFEPVNDGESVITRASLHNYSIMKDLFHNCLGWIGQKIYIAKMNQIIPQVISTEEWSKEKEFYCNYIETPTICPICGQPIQISTSDSGVINLICANPNCDGKLINKIEHFAGKSGLDIKGLSKKTLEKLIDWGWLGNIRELFSLSNFRSDWIKKPGFGPKSVDNILNAIENSKKCDLDKFICAIGIPLVGTNASKALAKEFKTWDGFISAVENTEYHFFNLNDFGPEAEYALKHFDYSEAKELANEVLEFAAAPLNETFSEDATNKGTMEGLTFVITGSVNHYKNRAELQEIIEKSGGKVTGSVSKNTNYLINNDSTSGSSKNVKAKSLGIPIITEEEFIERFI